MPPIDGPTCDDSSPRSGPPTSSPRMSNELPSREPPVNSTHSVIRVHIPVPPLPMWVASMAVEGGGLLPTPTAKANHDARSMSKWPAYKTYHAWLHGRKTSPELWEWMMAWPIGWTDSRPLGMARFQQWLQWHGASSSGTFVPVHDSEERLT